MAHYIYTAKRGTGELYTSEIEAGDRYEVYRRVRTAGDEIVSVDEKGGKKKFFSLNLSFKIPFRSGIKTQDKITFARNMSSMIEAGLTVSRALSVMERQSKNVELKKILTALSAGISSGKTLSDSMLAYKKMFSPLFISMVKAGEASGTLASSMKVVAVQMDRNFALERRVKGAMMYPSIIFIAMGIVGVLMLTYIVPTLTKTFVDLKVDLPASTQFIISLSNLIRDHGLMVLGALALALAGLYFWSKQAQGKFFLHFFILRLPVVGNIIKEVNAARTARTLASLLSSGVAVVESVEITRNVIQNVHYKKILDEAGKAIEKGDPMSKVFAAHSQLYPIFLGEMIAVGEETGKMSEMLINVAQFYEEDVEQKTKDMSTIIEPVLMVVIGGAVGFFAVAMISPMYSLANVI
ncbi:MAG: hypothetical protein RIT04_166 [Candidatus Parcubacteria bacterium]|jgi:type IV pilus assembly protein PilC